MDKDSRSKIFRLMVVTTMLIIWIVVLTYWNEHLMDQLNELKLRHEQLEEGFADFLDEYYQVELIWPDDYKFTGRFRK